MKSFIQNCMKKNIYIIVLSAIFLAACTDQMPVKLTYEDVYGYPYSSKPTPSNGSFFIKSASQLTFQEANKTDSTATYTIVTTGASPNFTTARIGGVINTSATVLSFMYKTDKVVTPTIVLDVTKANATGKMAPMTVTSEWKEYSWDLGSSQGLIATNSWGGVGSYFKLNLGIDNPSIPANILLKDIKFRKRTAAEETFANKGLWLSFTDRESDQISAFTDITSQEGGFNLFTRNAYSFKLLKNTNYIRTLPLDRAFLPNEQLHLKFDYKCEIKTALVMYVNVPNFSGPIVIDPLDATSVWKTVDYDFSGKIDFPQSVFTANPIQMSFYFPGNETPTMFIKGMHFYID